VANSVVTSDQRLHSARQFLESINEIANTAYYVFMGSHVPRANSDDTSVNSSISQTTIQVYHNMVQGKRVSLNDANLMIRNIPYETNKVFDMYDDEDSDLGDEDYYAIVNASSFYHVYKCLDNNMGANSTAEPNFAHIVGSNTYLYQTSDGYRWKYMYSVSSSTRDKFATSTYFPVVANADVAAIAADGVLDIIKVDGTGRGYDNYITGTFTGSDVRVNANTTLYRISNSASSSNGFYTGCLLYISTGTGAGGTATITDYFVTGDGNFIVIDTAFTTSPVNGSEYEIYPTVEVVGSGTQTVNVIARALVNATGSNGIYRVEVLERGSGYDFFTANVIANAVVAVESNAIVRPIYSPTGGHGADAPSELGASHLAISTKFGNSESNTLLTNNAFQQVGLLKDPLFANVEITFSDVTGTFIVGEILHKINPIRVDNNATINAGSTIVTSNNADFENQLDVGEYVYLAASDDSAFQLAVVSEIDNSSYMVIDTAAFFACTQTYIYKANQTSNGWTLAVNSQSDIHLSNVAGVLQSNDVVVGVESGARAVINTVSHNGVTKGFTSFVQLYKYVGTLSSGSFAENEIVYQTNLATSNASLHSFSSNGGIFTMYTSNQVGGFLIGGSNTIIGNTSGAIMSPSAKYQPELVFGSGKILYVENIEPVDRADDQSETIKLILEF
jgi:hypothetical protein